ncbi:AsmA family protein [Kangiella aquimarina]|uniref:AsmA family protein n=1 Tax=Kangiella aquimarina TaxID=261965 RepID=A0ABZ0X4B0_9GAMM|nr:AsmA family protein [Kangiella aquimarina]WQG85218.1 AsmA family protein [Kangiella aquimarina]
MKTLFKWSLRLIIAIVALFIVAAVALIIFFNSDQLKTTLTNQVKEKTGAELVIEQDLSLSFFPWLAIETGGITLSQPPGFTQDKPALEIGAVSASIKLLPLISGDIEVGAVSLTDATLNMTKGPQGKSNLQAFTEALQKKSEADTAQGTSTTKEALELSLQKLELTNFTVNQFDAKNTLSQSFTLEQLMVEDFNPGEFRPVLASGRIAGEANKPDMKWALAGDLKVSKDFKQIDLQKMDASVDNVSATIQSIALTGVLSVAQGDSTLIEHKGTAALDGQKIQLNASAGLGKVNDIKVSLSADSLTLDQFMATSSKKEVEAKPTADLSPIADFLKQSRIQGDLTIGSLNLKNSKFTDVTAKLFNKGATLHLDPFKAKAFQGELATTASVDFASKPLALAVQPDLNNIQIGDLLAAFFDFERLSGLGALDLDMKTKGSDAKQMLQNLNGTGHINLSDGALMGIDIEKLIASGLSLQSLNQEAYSGKTVFAGMKGDLKANNGVIDLSNFAINSPVFDLVGKATTDANKESIGGSFQLVLKGALKEQVEAKYPKLKDKKLPFELKGTWAEPKANIDYEAIIKAEYQGKIDEKKEELEDKVKDELEDKLGDFLKKKKKDN